MRTLDTQKMYRLFQSIISAFLLFSSLNIFFIFRSLTNTSLTGKLNEYTSLLQIHIIFQLFLLLLLSISFFLFVTFIKKQNFLDSKTINSSINKYTNSNTDLDLSILNIDFFSNILHELKTPLSVILGSVQLIEKLQRTNEFPMNSKHHQIIKLNSYRLLRLVNNLLDLSKANSGFLNLNLTNSNIVYLTEEITQSVIPYAQHKNISISFDTDCEEIITAVDVDKLERIVLNLLSNAIKFTPSNGEILVNVSKKSNVTCISIKDNGVGIPSDKQSTIFERFKQVDKHISRNSCGSGIGLSIVKSFVELHNGTISLISEENKGSEFIIELPINTNSSEIEDPCKVKNFQCKVIESINIEFSDMYKSVS